MFWVSLVIIFVECGLFFPFLPGRLPAVRDRAVHRHRAVDLFRGGDGVELVLACVLLTAAAFLGNVVGYEIGRAIGPPLYERDGRFLKQKYFDQTHDVLRAGTATRRW